MEGIGVDIIEVRRVQRLLDKWRDKFAKRVFSNREIAYCLKKKYPAPSLAARFAAKEAVLKAMGVGLGACPLKQIEIINEAGGKPRILLHGKARQLAVSRGVTTWQVSLSHSGTHAIAMVIAKG